MKLFVTHEHLTAHARRRPPAYLRQLEPAVIRRTPDGVWIDTAHPAYRAMWRKYRPGEAPAGGAGPSKMPAWAIRRLGICRACGVADCFVRRQRPCARRRIVKDPRKFCPHGKWRAVHA